MPAMGSRRPSDTKHTSSSDEFQSGPPNWTRKPSAAPKSSASTMPFDSADMYENPHKELINMCDDAYSIGCPPDFTLLKDPSKPNPTPLHHDQQHNDAWTFVQFVPDIQPSDRLLASRCPDSVSGGTPSRRNFSTRSIKSSIWEPIDDRNNNIRGVCLVQDCSGRCFNDVSAHSRITHLAEHRCPVKTCERASSRCFSLTSLRAVDSSEEEADGTEDEDVDLGGCCSLSGSSAASFSCDFDFDIDFNAAMTVITDVDPASGFVFVDALPDATAPGPLREWDSQWQT